MKKITTLSTLITALLLLPTSSFAKDSMTSSILGKSVDVHKCKGDRYQNEEGGPWADIPYGWSCDGGIVAPDSTIQQDAATKFDNAVSDGKKELSKKAQVRGESDLGNNSAQTFIKNPRP